MKLAISGKGGVGKTTIAALLCRVFVKSGYHVLAVDADPDANLAATLGFPDPEKIVPIVEMKDIIFERTGVKPGTMGLFYKLNPRVDDIPERFSVTHNGIRLLVMGRVKEAGTGCYCPENAFLKELVGHLLLEEKDVVIMDMEAGIEHLGRGTSRDVDAFLIVVEPAKRSIETARHIIELVLELGVKCYYIIANKVRGEVDCAFVKRYFSNDYILGMLPYSDDIAQSGKADNGISIEDITPINVMLDRLMKGVMNG